MSAETKAKSTTDVWPPGQGVDAGTIDFSKGGGYVPAIVQHADTGAVLMLGYMNREALEFTLKRRRTVFFSRSKQRLWEKGEMSGNTLTVTDIRADCDLDALLILARPQGPTCHRGTGSCFGDNPSITIEPSLSILSDLEQVINHRMLLRPEGSYTSTLFESGIRRIAQKVGEEGLETALAAAGGSDDNVVEEASDLLYHLLVMLCARGLCLERVLAELRARHVRGH